MYLKRQGMPKSWPVKRKGTKYVVKANFGEGKAIPVLILIRDLLGLAQNRKEVKRAIQNKHLMINGRFVRDEKNSLTFFDTLSIIPMKKHYRLEISDKGKFELKEINEKDSTKKISKIMDKKILKGKKTQINLSDGRNFISDLKCNVNDSAVINLKDKKIEKCIPLNKGSNVFVFAGKHSGKKGILKNITQEGKISEVDLKDSSINVLTKQIMAVQ